MEAEAGSTHCVSALGNGRSAGSPCFMITCSPSAGFSGVKLLHSEQEALHNGIAL